MPFRIASKGGLDELDEAVKQGIMLVLLMITLSAIGFAVLGKYLFP